MQPVKTKKKLSRADKKQIEAAIARANRTDKKGKSAQDSIPYERMWPDGICRISDSHYTKTIQFQDINYQLSQNEDKTAIFEGWCDFLNYFDSSIHFQLSFLNLAASEETFANSISIPPQRDAFDSIREEYTTMLQNQLARGNNGLIKTKYLTFGIDADSIKAAKPRLERIETDILNNFKRLGVAARTLDGKERLFQLHAVFHMDEQLPFQFEWDWLAPSGLSTKDFIAPSSFEFRTGKQFRMGKKYGAVSFLQILAPELNDRLLADFLDMESSLIVSMHIQSVDQVKAIKTVKRKITDLDRSKIEEQKKAVRAGYDMDIIPSDLATYGSEAKKLLQDLQSRNERMFLVSFLVLNTADNPRQLGNNIFQAGSIAQKYNCQLTRLDFQQEEGLMSCLPLGLNQIEIQRGLTTSSTAIFVPFTTQELFQNGKEALYYGINALSNNLIMVDRKLLKNPNGLILGTPGSGKSFSAKREIANCFLLTSDDVIICDPEAEYAPLVERLHGQVIKISPTSANYINPMDLNLDYSDDESPLSLKSDFILSLCELIVGGKEGLQPVQKTIIDRCVRLVYQTYLNDPRPENMPILEDLYNLLRSQEEKEAQYIATALEIYVTGSLNVFNHQSNVDINNRIVCYDIKELGKQLKKIGMLVVQDQVWNRVTINRAAHKSTRYYIDEMHLLLKEEQTAAYTVEIWKRFRKWGGIPTGITQNVKDLLSSREVENIFENSDFVYNHVFVFQLHSVHIGDDIALLFRRGGQIQHKAGIEVFQHFKAQFRPDMVALVHDDKRVKLVDNLEQGGFVRFFNGAVGFAQHLCKLGKIAVLLIGFQDLLAAPTERIIGQHHNRQLLRYGGGVEVLTVQKLLLGVNLHTPAEIHVDFLTVGMGCVFQGFRRLRQDRVRGNKPYDLLCLGSGECVKDRANGVAGNKGLAAARRHLEAKVRDTGYHVLVSP